MFLGSESELLSRKSSHGKVGRTVFSLLAITFSKRKCCQASNALESKSIFRKKKKVSSDNLSTYESTCRKDFHSKYSCSFDEEALMRRSQHAYTTDFTGFVQGLWMLDFLSLAAIPSSYSWDDAEVVHFVLGTILASARVRPTLIFISKWTVKPFC